MRRRFTRLAVFCSTRLCFGRALEAGPASTRISSVCHVRNSGSSKHVSWGLIAPDRLVDATFGLMVMV